MEFVFSGKNPVASWRAMAVTGNGDLHISLAQQSKQANLTVPDAGEYGSLRAKAVLDSGADISSIPETLSAFLEFKLRGVKIQSPSSEGPRYVRLTGGQMVPFKQ